VLSLPVPRTNGGYKRPVSVGADCIRGMSKRLGIVKLKAGDLIRTAAFVGCNAMESQATYELN
jgi:hypothetical protein